MPAQAPNAGTDPRLGDLCAAPSQWAPPFTHVYHLRKGGTVVFVAVEHTSDASSPTFAMIKAAFEHYRPGQVLIEGVSLEKSADDRYLTFLRERAVKAFVAGRISENLYAIYLAVENGSRYSGWDLSPHDEYIDDIIKGYAVPDMVGAHLLRRHVDPFASAASAAVQEEIMSLPHLRQPDNFDYASWYRGAYGDVSDLSAGTPCGKGIASRIIRSESERRTLNIANWVADAVKPGMVVLVEAGANHWLALRDHLNAISVRVD